jgi:acetyl esterase/lipase
LRRIGYHYWTPVPSSKRDFRAGDRRCSFDLMIRSALVNPFLAACLASGVCCGVLAAQDGSQPVTQAKPAELALRKQLGEGTPRPIPLWPDKPPKFVDNAPPETVDEHAHIRMVSVPTISVYLPPHGKATGMVVIVCPGGGYGALDWKTHVAYAADYFVPKGIAVIGLKYRTRPPHAVNNAGIQEIALLDAKRAVRTVRDRAREWHIDPNKIGVVGYSAGANLAMNLAASFDAGDEQAADPVERQSSRPDFAVGIATWHWGKKESPFTFRKDTPPVFLVHASNDGIGGGAPIEVPRAIKADLEKLGVPVHLEVFDQGAHGVGNLIPQRVKNGFLPAKWPELLLKWLARLPAADARKRGHSGAVRPQLDYWRAGGALYSGGKCAAILRTAVNASSPEEFMACQPLSQFAMKLPAAARSTSSPWNC